MKTFSEFSSDAEHDIEEELTEGALRNLGSVALAARIVSLSRQVQRSKDVGKQNALLAKQNVTLAGLVMANGKFLERSKG